MNLQKKAGKQNKNKPHNTWGKIVKVVSGKK